MKAGTHNHLKVKRLKRLLGIPLYRAVGILETLWLLCIDCCDEGNIGKFTDEEIADYLEWDGDPSALVRGLSDSGWTDPDSNGRPVIHDWLEHCPEYIRDRVRKRHARACKPHQNGSDHHGEPTYVPPVPDTAGQTRTTAVTDGSCPVYTQPIPTQPNPTNSNQGQPKNSAGKPRPVYSATFEAWFVSYPRKVGKQEASAAYGRAIDRIALSRALTKTDAHLWLVGVTQQFADTPAGKAGTFTPHPATWLNAGRYDDDPSEWQRENHDERKQQPPRVGSGQRFRG